MIKNQNLSKNLKPIITIEKHTLEYKKGLLELIEIINSIKF